MREENVLTFRLKLRQIVDKSVARLAENKSTTVLIISLTFQMHFLVLASETAAHRVMWLYIKSLFCYEQKTKEDTRRTWSGFFLDIIIFQALHTSSSSFRRWHFHAQGNIFSVVQPAAQTGRCSVYDDVRGGRRSKYSHKLDSTKCWPLYLPLPRRWCFVFVGLWTGLHKTYWIDFHQTQTEDGSRPRIDPINFKCGSR